MSLVLTQTLSHSYQCLANSNRYGLGCELPVSISSDASSIWDERISSLRFLFRRLSSSSSSSSNMRHIRRAEGSHEVSGKKSSILILQGKILWVYYSKFAVKNALALIYHLSHAQKQWSESLRENQRVVESLNIGRNVTKIRHKV